MTLRPVRRTARAEAELLAHVERIAGANLDAADTRLVGLRKWVLPRFPNYLLFYLFDGETVRLLHVFHAASGYDPSEGD